VALRQCLRDGHHMDGEQYHTLTGNDLIDRFG
jgi:hypothetical protein